MYLPRSVLNLCRGLAALTALAWMGLIFYWSSLPTGLAPMHVPWEDKLYHATAFGFLAICYLAAMRPGEQGLERRQALLAGVLAGLYGLTDEWHQGFVPTRVMDFYDLLADLFGGMLFAHGAWIFMRGWYRARLPRGVAPGD